MQIKSLVSQLGLWATAAPLLAATATATAAAAEAAGQTVNRRYTTEKDGVAYNVFEHAATGSKLEFVTNSGICETTPNVTQHSGYLTVGENMNMFFW